MPAAGVARPPAGLHVSDGKTAAALSNQGLPLFQRCGAFRPKSPAVRVGKGALRFYRLLLRLDERLFDPRLPPQHEIQDGCIAYAPWRRDLQAAAGGVNAQIHIFDRFPLHQDGIVPCLQRFFSRPHRTPPGVSCPRAGKR